MEQPQQQRDTVQTIFGDAAARAGWTPATQIDVLLQFVERLNVPDGLDNYLQKRLEVEEGYGSHSIVRNVIEIGKGFDEIDHQTIKDFEGETPEDSMAAAVGFMDEEFDRLPQTSPGQRPLWATGEECYAWLSLEDDSEPEVETVSLLGKDYMDLLDKVVEIAEGTGNCRLELSVHERMPKPGRNDKCFCGSGRKYKKCCLGVRQPSRTRKLPRKSYLGDEDPQK